jgi:bifunctional DNA-binding transcriptional regulator/antitoxin component of YhaV-PrlF toxin-antitoxin module
MHDDLTIVTERGQTSIPAALRRALKLRRGTQLSWERISDTEMRVRLVQPKRKPDPMAMIGFGAKFGFTESTDEYMKRMREGDRE